MKTILKKWQMLLMLVLTLGITACSDDNGGNGDNGDDDGDNLSDILFENGTQLGNGADEMEINGNYKLPKGVYVMKGWLYITDGSSPVEFLMPMQFQLQTTKRKKRWTQQPVSDAEPVRLPVKTLQLCCSWQQKFLS